ncbi:hypothetical protein SASPL_123197 [Salvia splendens]|uniref:Uncharacterized protein n=1 Tax=Salvia splendens TaxID=180675 RepID=A0A8X8XNK9_SALSN|nr:hypothetical protein SASPL_123197 [Salvia splendens]
MIVILVSFNINCVLKQVILDEIGWLNFYAAYNNQLHQERRRSKHPPIQAEMCNFFFSDVSIQALLSTCLEDYWVAYDGTVEMPKIVEKNNPDMRPSLWMNGTKSSSAVDTRYRPAEINRIEKHSQNQVGLIDQSLEIFTKHAETIGSLSVYAISTSSSFQGENEAFLTSWQSKQKTFQRNILKSTRDVWMGTQLLFVDISYTMRLVQKRLHGHRVTQRERKKIYRTTSDMFTLIPVAILMLLPVSWF